MTIDNRFSKTQFQKEAESNPGARHLSDGLQQEVLTILQVGVVKKVQEIVDLLNRNGHRLSMYYPPRLGDVAFRDDRSIDGNYECDLRLGVDVVVSVGYRDTKAGFEEFGDGAQESGCGNGESS